MIFGLMAKAGVHTETATRSAQAIAKWQSIYDQYFNPISGAGRAWTMWTNPRDGLNKFRKTTMAALEFHAKAFNNGLNAPTQVQILANDLVVERNAALAAQEALSHSKCNTRAACSLPIVVWVLSLLVKAFCPRPIWIMRSIATKN